MTFKVVEIPLSADVAASGTITFAYPSGTTAADFDPDGPHLATIAGAQLTSAGSDFSLTFGGSDITFTNGSSAVTLPKGRSLFVQMIEFTADVTGADQKFTNLDLGAPGQAGTLDVYPSTDNKGKLLLVAADSAGDTTTTITNASQAAARTYTIPDAGASTAAFVMDEGGTTKNVGTSAATSVSEHGDGTSHVTVLTATALAWPDTPDGSSLALGDLIYTFPAGDILVEHVYMNIVPNPAGAENDAVVADVGVGTIIGTAAVAILSGTADTEDFITGQAVTVDSSNGANVVAASTGGGPMYIEAADDHKMHVNIAAAWLTSSDNSIDYTGTVVIIWKYLGA